MTYEEIYEEFRNKCECNVDDYRPCTEMFDVPNIPNAIVVWLKDGGKLIYIHKDE